MSSLTILLTGASGYIGGAVLAKLLSSGYDASKISALVRSHEHAQIVQKLGINSVLFEGLHDLGVIKREASNNDIVISCASAMDLPSCIALVEGLGERKAKYGKDVYYIHTSGTSNFGDHPYTGKPNLEVRGDKDDNFSWEKENAETWIIRKVDVAITEAGIRLGVKTAIVNPPLIYGTGEGPINQRSLQVPTLIKMSLGFKQAIVLGEGSGIWTVVHIADVAKIYSLLVQRIVDGKAIEFGKQGYYFVETGEVTWLDISKAIARSGHTQGLFPTAEVKEVSPVDFASALNISFLNAHMVEVIWGSNSRIKGVKSREIGWQPDIPATDFVASVEDEVRIVYQQQAGQTESSTERLFRGASSH
ncbi:hypothetical protein PV11_00355 [Exophiala sideris]|uniref:Thioester reductase (TE) domain-containing protein n=1 Tax=Exophiala sideris TaxID=1016849 RepID=A0A0D1YP30_9EURO|nr:hypothetical protein PV11_00355 [Exophiala sideris]